MAKTEEIREHARKLLAEGKVKYVIGYGLGSDRWKAVPAFIRTPDDVHRLVWNPTCVHNLARFLVDEKRRQSREKRPDRRPVAVVVKGCDSRAIVVLLQEKFINREDIVILGVACEKSGVVDEDKLSRRLAGRKPLSVDAGDQGKIVIRTEKETFEWDGPEILAERCLECRANSPVIFDVLVGEKIPRPVDRPFGSIQGIEELSTEERWKFWRSQLEKCIRCYACRSVCPMCYCDECVVDSINLAVTADTTADEKAQKIRWVEKSPVVSENFIYHLVRAIHLAGRCIDCGECQRACPLDIPLRFLNKKLEKEAKELFGYEVGFDVSQPALISCFRDEDPGEFIR